MKSEDDDKLVYSVLPGGDGWCMGIASLTDGVTWSDESGIMPLKDGRHTASGDIDSREWRDTVLDDTVIGE